MFGIGLSVIATVLFVVAIGPWFSTLNDSLEVTGQALVAVDNTMGVMDDALVVFSDTLVGVDGVFAQTEATLNDVNAVVLSTAGLLSEELPAQVDSIQLAMDGLIDTANIVDGILGALSFVGVGYDPAVPLDEALIAVNTQLGELGDSLATNSAGLLSMSSSVGQLTEEIGSTAAVVSGLENQIEDSQRLITQYQRTANEAQLVIAEASQGLSGQLWMIRLVGAALLFVLAISFSLVWWAGRSQRVQE